MLHQLRKKKVNSLPSPDSPENRLEKTTQLERIQDEDRLVPLDFTYGSEQIREEVIRGVDAVDSNGKRFNEYPPKGLKISRAAYMRAKISGKLGELLIGHPNSRPEYFVSHTNRFTPEGDYRRGVQPVDTLEPTNSLPLHPYLQAMVTESKRGALTGPGFYYHLGANITADPVILRVQDNKLQVLMVERVDGGGRALPGGHVDPEDEALSQHPALVAIMAAMREVGEEAGVKDLHNVDREVILANAVVGDWRATANAWPETTVVLFMPDEKTAAHMEAKAGDDAKNAEWRPIWSDINTNTLFASHESYIKLAILKWEEKTGQVVRKDGVIGRAA